MCKSFQSDSGALNLLTHKSLDMQAGSSAAHIIMVALVAAATSGSTPISSISGPCIEGTGFSLYAMQQSQSLHWLASIICWAV